MTDTNTNTPHGTIASALVYCFHSDKIMVWWKENPNDGSLHDSMKAQIDKDLARVCERFYILNPVAAVTKQDWYTKYTRVFQPKSRTRLTHRQMQLLSKGFSESPPEKGHLFTEQTDSENAESTFQAKFIKL